jgi:dephospho-CoA kinase
MIIVGLTGGIGSGKSFVGDVFIQLGIPVYNSDLQARELNDNHPKIIEALTQRYGPDAYIKGKLNRPLVAQKVFNNKQELQWLNHLVHPLVRVDFGEWLSRQNSAYVIREAAILIESGTHSDCDAIIVVTAPFEERLKRVMQRDNLTKEQVLQRMANQFTEDERLKYADFIINNDGIQLVKAQVEKIHNEILSKI